AVAVTRHALGVGAKNGARFGVMHPAPIAGDPPAARLFPAPAHPYPEGLLAALPDLEGPRRRLAAIPGVVPEPWNLPPGCSFAPRCPEFEAACEAAVPDAIELGHGHRAACIHASSGLRASCAPHDHERAGSARSG